MQICEVVGNIWATRKREDLEGYKFLIVTPLNSRLKKGRGDDFVAVDCIGAGIGEQVLVVSGSSARQAVGNDNAPIDSAIIGIIDSLEVKKNIESR